MRLESVMSWRRQKHLVVAVIKDEASVIAAVRRLQRAGIESEEISLVALDTKAIHDAIHQIGPVHLQQVQADQVAPQLSAALEDDTQEGRPEVEGIVAGGCIGFVLGLSLFAIPGLGATLLAAGPVVMAVNVLAHTLGGGIGLGLVLGAIFDERVTEDHRNYYRERLEAGSWLLVVHGEKSLIERVEAEVPGDQVERVESF